MPSRRISLTAVAIGIATVQLVLPVPALAGANRGRGPQWRVEVNPIDAGGLSIAPEFKIAIYENLVTELTTARQFTAVLRSGDCRANGVSNLLILKTTVESYTQGSETKRAVTTVTGATKLKVRSQLCTRDGQVVLERVVDGNVRFFGGNLRATHKLARNVVKAIKQGTLPEAAPSNQTQIGFSPRLPESLFYHFQTANSTGRRALRDTQGAKKLGIASSGVLGPAKRIWVQDNTRRWLFCCAGSGLSLSRL